MGVVGWDKESLGHLAEGALFLIVGQGDLDGLCILVAGSEAVNAGLGLGDCGLCLLLACGGLGLLGLLGLTALALLGKQHCRCGGGCADGCYDKPFLHDIYLRTLCCVFNYDMILIQLYTHSQV